jgi:hypothetical protein
MRNKIVFSLLGAMVSACGGNGGSGRGTFPDFGTLALQSTPNLATAALIAQGSGGLQSSFNPFAINVPGSSSLLKNSRHDLFGCIF